MNKSTDVREFLPLYDTPLYQLPDEAFGMATGGIPGVENLSIKGENTKNVLIALKKADQREPTEEEWAFLWRILAAIPCHKEDVAVILLDSSKITAFNALKKRLACRYFMGFGATPSDLHIQLHIPFYTPYKLSGCHMLLADELEKLNGVTKRKEMLWAAMKSIYNIGNERRDD